MVIIVRSICEGIVRKHLIINDQISDGIAHAH